MNKEGSLAALKSLVAMTVVTSAAEKKKRDELVRTITDQIYLMDRGERPGKTIGAFRQRYLKPGLTNGYTVYSWLLQPGAEKEIQQKISDICMSIDQKEYATLPDCQMIDLMVDLKADLDHPQTFQTARHLAKQPK